MQQHLFSQDCKEVSDEDKNEKILEDLFRAYFSARVNKRKKTSSMQFELNFESNILELYDEIIQRKYVLSPSTCFITNKPVKREIFAADFRDRIIHHFLYNYLSPIYENQFISDSYSCREGKGVHYGIKRIDHFIRSCSENYKKDCYILKLDISGYFMNIRRDLLFLMVKKELEKRKDKIDFDFSLAIYLLDKIINSDPTKECIVRGNKEDWQGLPKTKSLFYSKNNCGLPIGNLTSQLFANVYLNDFDHFVKKDLGIRYYGRYVDDMVIIHKDKNYLKKVVFEIEKYLEDNLCLRLHPKKRYLQHYSYGVEFLGSIIKKDRIYVSERLKGNFWEAINSANMEIAKEEKIKDCQKEKILSQINSYLGFLSHFQTYNLKKKMIFLFNASAKEVFSFNSEDYKKIKVLNNSIIV
jgi:hypothetical protein